MKTFLSYRNLNLCYDIPIFTTLYFLSFYDNLMIKIKYFSQIKGFFN